MEDAKMREEARKYVRELREFYSHVATFVVINIVLNIINWLTSPGYWWAKWPLLGWGIGLIMHGFSLFGLDYFFGKDWEERKIDEIVKKKQDWKNESKE